MGLLAGQVQVPRSPRCSSKRWPILMHGEVAAAGDLLLPACSTRVFGTCVGALHILCCPCVYVGCPMLLGCYAARATSVCGHAGKAHQHC
jgi:hypothetical protein